MSDPKDAPVKKGMMSLEDAMATADDLPDGAYFALVEELSGYEPGEMAPYCAEEDD